uniref:SAP domain-containing ribonucleoprotein n=1 Tax=Papio anubis TaxID=9555 RepID=A0A8I5NGR7_PAPAN
MATETVEFHKLKLAELKQECLACGLETKGIKQDLIHRLQAYLEEHRQRRGKEQSALGLPNEKFLILCVLQCFLFLSFFLVTHMPKCTVMCLRPASQ